MSTTVKSYVLTKARLLNCKVETRKVSMGTEVEITAPDGFCMGCEGDGLHSIVGRNLGASDEIEMWDDLNDRLQHGVQSCYCQECRS